MPVKPARARPRTLVAPRGWDDLADAGAFYPEDLPTDWRLTYFANSFGAVLLPWPDWCDQDAAGLGQWRADVPDGFRFFLQGAPTPSVAERARVALGDRLAGLIEPDGERPAGTLLRCCSGAAGAGYGVAAPAGLNADLRGARDWLRGLIQDQGEAPRLVILARPGSGQLTAWQDLLLLLLV